MLKNLSGCTQRYGEGEVVPKGTPTGPVDLEDGDPGGEYNHPKKEAHSRAPDIAFDLALLCVCRDKEGLSEEPEDVDQPEKRQESKPTQVVLAAQVQLLFVGHPLQVHSGARARSFRGSEGQDTEMQGSRKSTPLLRQNKDKFKGGFAESRAPPPPPAS